MITKEFWGSTLDNKTAGTYRIRNANGMSACVTDYGAALTELIVPAEPAPLDVVLGYDTVSSYEANKGQFGATVGRNANRIRGARFALNGKQYTLCKDPSGNNSHSGPDFYNKRIWNTGSFVENDASLTFSLNSTHMDQGFPGNLQLAVTYSVTEDNSLTITYDAVSDQDTVLNITNHSYFNLNGHQSGDVLSHTLWINADTITETDDMNIPTGKLLPVRGTIYDFTSAREIVHEYDDNWCLNNGGLRKLCAVLQSPFTGMAMEMYTDLPGVQVYTAGGVRNVAGKRGAVYGPHSGICLETQYYVNAINIPEFPQPVIKAFCPYRTQTTYRFLSRKDNPYIL